MQDRISEHAHAEWSVDVEVVDAKQLHARLDGGKESPLDLNPLRRQRVERRSALDPVHEIPDPDREDGDDPLTERRDRRGMPGEQRTLDFGFLRALMLAEIGVAEAALDGHGL